MTGQRSLAGRRIHVAGSSRAETPADRIRYAHDLVRLLVRTVLADGGGLVIGVGKEPPAAGAPDGPSVVFDWTALEEVAACARNGTCAWPAVAGPPVVVAISEKAESEIPPGRRGLWEALLEARLVRVESIMAGARSAALIRQRQAEFGDCAVLLGGGTGVEHLAELYRSRRRSVVPLDIPLGPSRGDGTGGAERLSREARADPARFLEFGHAAASTIGANLAAIATREGAVPAALVVAKLVGLMRRLSPPAAFCVRLLNRANEDFNAVEAFFRQVMDRFIDELGFERFEMGRDEAKHPFMNVEIFERLHFASLAVVDLTASRPDCMIELGYALARGLPVLLCAQHATKLPFDPDKIPCHFWRPAELGASGLAAVREFWSINGGRPPLVR